ncbi:hypothetical protein V2A60_000255 [Cordyceps javanica]
MSSADTTPITPARFAAALKDLSVPMLHLKVLEIRNAIAHLQYSNDQLRPFAAGTAVASSVAVAAAADHHRPASSSSSSSSSPLPGEPDQDCVDAIRENEHVIARMEERIALVRIEVEERGVAWDEFASKEGTEAGVARGREEEEEQQQQQTRRRQRQQQEGEGGEGEEEEITGVAAQVNGATAAAASPWTDGTFQTGTIRNGEVRMDAQPGVRLNGGSLSDEQLRAAMEERMRQMTTTEDDDDDGMHL